MQVCLSWVDPALKWSEDSDSHGPHTGCASQAHTSLLVAWTAAQETDVGRYDSGGDRKQIYRSLMSYFDQKGSSYCI